MLWLLWFYRILWKNVRSKTSCFLRSSGRETWGQQWQIRRVGKPEAHTAEGSDVGLAFRTGSASPNTERLWRRHRHPAVIDWSWKWLLPSSFGAHKLGSTKPGKVAYRQKEYGCSRQARLCLVLSLNWGWARADAGRDWTEQRILDWQLFRETYW